MPAFAGRFRSLLRRTAATVPAGPSVAAVILGQSEPEYLFNTDSFYRVIPQAVPANGNLVVWTHSPNGSAPVRTLVNPTTVAAGQVNPAMAAMSAFLGHVRPGMNFVLGDCCVPGTSRYQLADGTNIADRLWSDLTAVVAAVEADAGRAVQAVIECWYNSDATSMASFKASFWPLYFGRTAADGAFALGSTNPAAANTTAVFNNCLWDGAAAIGAKGRGVFTRADTKWRVLTPMPFCDGPSSPAAEATSFFQSGLRNQEPVRETIIGLAADSLAASVDLDVGPSAHISQFGGGIHPVVDDPDGQILLMWPFALRLAELGGLTVNEPTIVGIEGPSDGSYVDMVVDLPNGGNLTTIRALESRAAPATPAPHQQAVTGFEIARGGTRRPVYKTSETSYPAPYRGTVAITDAGSGSPRRGRVRITPSTAFAFGDSLSYLRGQATAMLIEPRDVDAKLYLDMLIEHVPAWRNASATYPFPGVAVRPFQQDILAPVSPPAFTNQSTRFNGSTSNLQSTSLSYSGGNEGTIAFWIFVPSAWPASGVILQTRAGSSITLEARLASTGRITFDLKPSSSFTVPTNTFAVDRWHHVIWSYKAGAEGWNHISINGADPINGVSLTAATLQINGAQTRLYVGSSAGITFLGADLGFLYADLDTALDITNAAVRAQFINTTTKLPVYLGPNGQIPAGAVPHFYLDGGAAMSNLGFAGSLTPTALAAGGAPALP